MGFGITSLKKQTEDEIQFKKIFIDHLIVGEDFATALAFTKLCKQFGPEKVLWLKTFQESKEDFEKKWEHFSFLSVNHNSSEMKPQSACFYKDQQFRLFTGRSQPQKMSEVEKKLLGEQSKISWTQVLEDLEIKEAWESFNSWKETRCIETEIFSFFKSQEQDLVEKDKFCIQSSSHELFIAENIYWGSSCQSLRSIMDRELLDESIKDSIELRAGSEIEVPALIVHLEHEKEINYPELLTSFSFIPVSQSQEEGHFIGELEAKSVTLFHHFQDEGELTKEEVARRIKKLKKNLERIFKTKEFQKSTENIYFSSSLFSIPRDSEEEIKFHQIEKLHFLPIQSFSNNLLLDKINHLKTL